MGDPAPAAVPVAGPVLVALKGVAARSEVDALSGVVSTDDRGVGASPADRAALEWGLRLAGPDRAGGCVAVSVGGSAVEAMLREALACGAAAAVRVDPGGHDDEPPSSAAVAEALAGVARSLGARLVLTGDWSLDRGTGSVPPLVAAHLGWPSALGLVALDPGADGTLRLERRLDGGRRQVLELAAGASAVLSVEGATASLRRAPIAGVLAARSAAVRVEHMAVAASDPRVTRLASGPFRPRPRTLDAPPPDAAVRRRLEVLVGVGTSRTPPQRLRLDPGAAADRILEQLRAWGELDSAT